MNARRTLAATALAIAASGTIAATAGATTAHCINGYCTQGPYVHMTLPLAAKYTLQRERRYFAPQVAARNIRVTRCSWQHAPFTARCSVRVRMALLLGERGKVLVTWTDVVDQYQRAYALPWTGHVVGLVELTSS
jgi:hypothetical protein